MRRVRFFVRLRCPAVLRRDAACPRSGRALWRRLASKARSCPELSQFCRIFVQPSGQRDCGMPVARRREPNLDRISPAFLVIMSIPSRAVPRYGAGLSSACRLGTIRRVFRIAERCIIWGWILIPSFDAGSGAVKQFAGAARRHAVAAGRNVSREV